jgi:acetyl-CoA synthetase
LRKEFQLASQDPDKFWSEVAQRILWDKPFDQVSDWSFRKPVKISWYLGGRLNVAKNCLDRHLNQRADQAALIWQPDEEARSPEVWTYQRLHQETCRLANGLKSIGVKKGDRVTIYMPMIPQAVAAMLACARIGAIHSVVFAGFSPESIADRIQDAKSEFVITCDEGVRGGNQLVKRPGGPWEGGLGAGRSMARPALVRVSSTRMIWL